MRKKVIIMNKDLFLLMIILSNNNIKEILD